ncbi:hypothetical protein A3Q56_05263 [Intoshia linei]|uniref:Tc1-like transposase DDE domain-containing protein n=1 Tax=Intoshia linei TaxID=1819745 RepID=A0A177AYC9_9BILA|nr:hypothetical protein A3Q56_05263 [Intoshia linei]
MGAIREDGQRIIVRCANRVNSVKYIRILNRYIDELHDTRYIFQHDGAPCHRSRMTNNFIKNRYLNTLDSWPPQSPDLNIIKHVWSMFQINVSKIKPRNLEQLWTVTRKKFYKIPDEYIKNLFKSLPRRINSVIGSNGEWGVADFGHLKTAEMEWKFLIYILFMMNLKKVYSYNVTFIGWIENNTSFNKKKTKSITCQLRSNKLFIPTIKIYHLSKNVKRLFSIGDDLKQPYNNEQISISSNLYYNIDYIYNLTINYQPIEILYEGQMVCVLLRNEGKLEKMLNITVQANDLVFKMQITKNVLILSSKTQKNVDFYNTKYEKKYMSNKLMTIQEKSINYGYIRANTKFSAYCVYNYSTKYSKPVLSFTANTDNKTNHLYFARWKNNSTRLSGDNYEYFGNGSIILTSPSKYYQNNYTIYLNCNMDSRPQHYKTIALELSLIFKPIITCEYKYVILFVNEDIDIICTVSSNPAFTYNAWFYNKKKKYIPFTELEHVAISNHKIDQIKTILTISIRKIPKDLYGSIILHLSNKLNSTEYAIQVGTLTKEMKREWVYNNKTNTYYEKGYDHNATYVDPIIDEYRIRAYHQELYLKQNFKFSVVFNFNLLIFLYILLIK